MRTLGIAALCIAVVIGGGVIWYMLAHPTYIYRYRITVEVLVDGVVRSGSSVIEVQIYTQPNLLANSTTYSTHSGEASFVDLGGGRHVIALLAAGPRARDVGNPEAIVPSIFKLSYDDADLTKFSILRGRGDIPQKRLPTLVTFDDLNDAKTARIISPDEFTRVFGPGVSLQRAWIEMTDDPVTRVIEAKMPQIIRQLREQAKVMQIKEVGAPYTASLGDFTGG